MEGEGMTIRISISCEPDEVDEVRRLLLGFVVADLKQSSELYGDNNRLSPAAERIILERYDDGESIRDIAADLDVDGRRIAGLVLGKRKNPNCAALRSAANGVQA
jgi:hypothetical protein